MIIQVSLYRFLDVTEAKSISDIVVGPDAIRVGAHHAGVGIAALLPGAVNVAVAEGVVLVLVLGVVLGGGHTGHSGPNSSNSRSRDSPHSSNSSNSRSRDSPHSSHRCGGGDGSDSGPSSGVSLGIGVGVTQGCGASSPVVRGVQSISISLATGQGGDRQNDLDVGS